MDIFLSNFLALLIKVDSAGVQQAFLGSLVMVVNALLFLTVALATWFTEAVADRPGEVDAAAIAGTMLAFEQQAAAGSRSMREK